MSSRSPTAALVFSFLEKYTSLSIGIVSTMLLSRLLTPADIGVYSIGIALTALMAQFRDFGVSSFLVQEPDLTEVKFRSALGVSMIIATLMILLTCAGSIWAAALYKQPGIAPVMQVTAIGFAIVPFNGISVAWARRHMRFDIVYQMTVVGMTLHALTGITLAYLDAGYMALPWASVANISGNAAVAYYHRQHEFSWWPSLRAWRQIVGFGSYATVGGMCIELTPRAADLSIGARFGAAAVGQFSRANGLVNLARDSLISAIMPVAMAVFALKRRGSDSMAPAYFGTVSMVTAVAWPAFAFLALMAYPIIRILFGAQWDMAVAPSRLIAIAAMISCMITLHYMIFQAAGAMRPRMIVQLLVTPVQIAILVLTARYGLVAVAEGVVANALIEFVPSQIVIDRIVGDRFTRALGAMWKSLVVTLASSAGPALVLVWMPPTQERLWVPLLLGGGSAFVPWVCVLFLLRHPLALEIRRVLCTEAVHRVAV